MITVATHNFPRGRFPVLSYRNSWFGLPVVQLTNRDSVSCGIIACFRVRCDNVSALLLNIVLEARSQRGPGQPQLVVSSWGIFRELFARAGYRYALQPATQLA